MQKTSETSPGPGAALRAELARYAGPIYTLDRITPVIRLWRLGLSGPEIADRTGEAASVVTTMLSGLRDKGCDVDRGRPHRHHNEEQARHRRSRRRRETADAVIARVMKNRAETDCPAPIEELGDHRCHWPISDTENLFCGAAAIGGDGLGRSYCAHHARAATATEPAP